MRTQKELLISWLNDAYSMETSLIPMLQNHAKDFSHLPEFRERDKQHVEETHRHAELVRECIEELGGSVLGVKSVVGALIEAIKSVSTGMFADEAVKNALADYASEHFEIASYKALIVAARDLGEERVARKCEQILKEDEAMAQWLDEKMQVFVRESLKSVGP